MTTKKMGLINFDVSATEARLIDAIADRALSEIKNYPDSKMTLTMDIIACHKNGSPLVLEQLAQASTLDFTHDILGIRRHINRETGEIEGCFVPRYHDKGVF